MRKKTSTLIFSAKLTAILKIIVQLKEWSTLSVRPSSYGCTREAAKHKRSVTTLAS